MCDDITVVQEVEHEENFPDIVALNREGLHFVYTKNTVDASLTCSGFILDPKDAEAVIANVNSLVTTGKAIVEDEE